MTQQHADGIYFDMPEDEYHAIQRLSASGIASMMVSPATFWAKSWLNPNREEGDKKHQVTGRAYHCARLEPDMFDLRYCRQPSPSEWVDLITTDAEIKDRLKGYGLPQSKAGEKVLDRAKRLSQAFRTDPYSDGEPPAIWHLILDEWEQQRGDRVGIAADVWDDIQEDAQRLRSCPEVAELITGGEAEVTVLWTDPASGVPMKARLDYLRSTGYTDFKTFDNSRGKHLDKAISDAFQFNRYYIQASLYWQAAELVRTAALPLHDDTMSQSTLCHAIHENKSPMQAWYVFQEKSGVPNILAKRFITHAGHVATDAQAPDGAQTPVDPTAIFRKAVLSIAWAQKQFNLYREVYADGEPWLPLNPIGTIDDADFSPYFLESEY